MSFILDALKKSENERQRQIGPSLADVRTVRRNAVQRPWWVVAVAALLVVNLGVLLVVLMRDGDAKPAPQTQQAAPVQTVPAQPAPVQSAPAQNYAPAPMPANQGYAQPAPAQQSYQPRAVDPSVRSLADEASAYEQQYQQPYPSEPMNPALAAAGRVPEGPPMVRQIEPPAVAPLPGRVVYDGRNAAGGAPSAATTAAANETLPTAGDLTVAGTNLPELHLDIHVHSENPKERFVFVNMRKYLEGETLKEGPVVERITAEGVVLNQRGLRFLLPRQ